MGVNLGRVKDIDIRTVNELFLLTQPAHLQKIQGRKLEGDVRRAARADYIRQRLGVDFEILDFRRVGVLAHHVRGRRPAKTVGKYIHPTKAYLSTNAFTHRGHGLEGSW